MGDKFNKLIGFEPMNEREKAALRREDELHAAIQQRGKDLGMSTKEIAQVALQARRELKRRGMTWQQQ